MSIEESQFQKAIHIIRRGGLVIAPTETFYGILGNAWSRNAVKRLIQLKGRDFGQPIPLIAPNVSMVREAAMDLHPLFKPVAKRFWPGPLTVVLKAAKGFPRGITAGTESIGIRIPGPSPALDLARFYNGHLTATSANFREQPAPRGVQELDPELTAQVDLVVDGGWTPGGLPSTVLNLTTTPPVILRRGVLGEEVEEFLEKTMKRKIGRKKD